MREREKTDAPPLRLWLALALLLGLAFPILPAAAAPARVVDGVPGSTAQVAPNQAPALALGNAVDPSMTSAIPCGASVPAVELPQYRSRTSRCQFTADRAPGFYESAEWTLG